MDDKFRSPPIIIAGVDIAYNGDTCSTACVAMGYPPKKIVEVKTICMPVPFPYVPTLLAFREGPATLAVMSAMEVAVDIFLINGHGIAHPLRFGLASHVGVLSGKPTIGVASSLLVGECDREPLHVNEAMPLTIGGDAVGWVLKPQSGSRPIIVSPGHLVGMSSSLEIVRNCLCGDRLPRPLRMAHLWANKKE